MVEVDAGPEGTLEIPHSDALELPAGTIAFTFTADSPEGRDKDTLFSKDARGYVDGGHVTAWVQNERLTVRLQTDESEVKLVSGSNAIEAGKSYAFAFSFGEDGAQLYLDGDKIDAEPEFTQDLTPNTFSLVLGANTWARDDRNPDWRADYFDGTIEDFSVYDHALTKPEIAWLAGEDMGPIG